MRDLTQLPWLYDEFHQVGTDYALPEEAENYDARHADFRDVPAECAAVLALLGVTKETVLMDLGTGTGAFAIHAAKSCAKVIAVDVSEAMLRRAKERAEREGVDNVEFCVGGFLSYGHQGPAVDAVSTSFALHHLPDFWKHAALRRMHGMLKPGGLLHLHDVVLAEDGALDNARTLIHKLGQAGGENMRLDAERHFKEEFSTFDWIMDGLLTRAGFEIRDKRMQDGVLATYLCAALPLAA